MKFGKKILLSIVIVFGITLLGMAVYYNYVDGREEVPVFKVVPEKPDDFDAYYREIDKGMLYVSCDVPEEYWKQPEFYSSWEIAKEKFYDNPDYSRWGLHGYGIYPNKVGYTVKNMNPGDSFELCLYFYNGFGIWAWKGFSFAPSLGNYDEYFNMEFTPNEVLVDPTAPVFGENWVHKIKVKVTAKKEIPSGNYDIGFNVASPSKEFSRQSFERVLYGEYPNKELYKRECTRRLGNEEWCSNIINLREKKYVDGGGYGIGGNLFNLNIQAKGNEYLIEKTETQTEETQTGYGDNNEI